MAAHGRVRHAALGLTGFIVQQNMDGHLLGAAAHVDFAQGLEGEAGAGQVAGGLADQHLGSVGLVQLFRARRAVTAFPCTV